MLNGGPPHGFRPPTGTLCNVMLRVCTLNDRGPANGTQLWYKPKLMLSLLSKGLNSARYWRLWPAMLCLQ